MQQIQLEVVCEAARRRGWNVDTGDQVRLTRAGREVLVHPRQRTVLVAPRSKRPIPRIPVSDDTTLALWVYLAILDSDRDDAVAGLGVLDALWQRVSQEALGLAVDLEVGGAIGDLTRVLGLQGVPDTATGVPDLVVGDYEVRAVISVFDCAIDADILELVAERAALGPDWRRSWALDGVELESHIRAAGPGERASKVPGSRIFVRLVRDR